MENGKSVEIIIPVYNTEASLIAKCIDTINAQSYQNIKTTIINDGSTHKDTLLYLESLQNSNSNINIISKPNGGVSSARNLGLDKATCNYVLFLDADDYISENYIEDLVRMSEEQSVDVVYRKIANVTKKGSIIRYDTFPKARMNLGKDIGKIVFRSFILSCHGALISTSIAQAIRFDTSLTIGEDTDYMIKVLDNNDFAYCKDAIYYYVINDGSAMRSYGIEKTRRYFNDVNKLVLRIEKRFPEYSSEICSVLYNNLNNACDRLCRSRIGMKRTIEIMKEFRNKISQKATTNFEKKRIDKRISISLLIKEKYTIYYLFNMILIKLKHIKGLIIS